MGTLIRSFDLVRTTFAVLQKDKELLVFPLFSFFFSAIAFLVFLLPIFLSMNKLEAANPLNTLIGFHLYFFAYYVITYFITYFFTAGVISCAYMRLEGKNPNVKDGLRIAFKNTGKIFLWSLISATVGFILKQIAERSKLIGKIIAAVLGLMWSLLTFFVIPVMIIEQKGVFSSIKRSAALFKDTWGENIVGQISIGIFFFAVGIIGIIAGVILVILLYPIFGGYFTIVMWIFLMLYITFLSLVSTTLQGIFVAALYRYATTKKISLDFDTELLQSAFTKN
ncbi:hypothetical protein C4573_04860 [Candidatus Woesearchaeota archaeon]|nr:MAG: hypothetical protein C4573_04860 [Candidatus Woesearchaeota archaeon]